MAEQQQQQPMDVDAGPQRQQQQQQPVINAPTSEHYRRLQALEAAVVAAVSAAAGAVAELSRAAGCDPAALRARCEAFLEGVAEAQRLLLAAVRGAAADRGLEASAYAPMVKATLAGEKVAALLAHLRGLERRLQALETANR